MVALVVGLAAAVLFEWSADRHACFQASISAYYYTPVRPYFVSALVAIGVCLICLRGNTDPEDVLLNVAGVAAAVVGLVPTPRVGSCMSTPVGSPADVRDVIAGNVANNVFALLIAGAAGLLVLGILVGWRAARRRVWPARTTAVAFAVAVIAEVGAVFVFYLARSSWLAHAHTVAALTLFGCIFVVVSLNAAAHWNGVVWLRNVYVAIASGMALAMLVVGIVAAATPWHHATLVLEGVFITLFAAFWSVQTHELWNAGLRPLRAGR